MTKKLSSEQIGDKIKNGDTFTVRTASDRKRVLLAASFLGKAITSRKQKDGRFMIFPMERKR